MFAEIDNVTQDSGRKSTDKSTPDSEELESLKRISV
jgi:hypothetical protein